MNSKKVLLHLIRAGRDAIHLEQTLNNIGYKETPFFNIYGEIADAVYEMLGEKTDSFDESMTYAAMHDIYTSDEQCAERLADMVNQDINIPDATMEIIQLTANELHIETSKLINLILSDWARKEVLFKSI